MTRKHPKVRKPRTILRELAAEFEPECANRNECIAEGHNDCPINRFRALIRELRASLRENDGHTKGRRP